MTYELRLERLFDAPPEVVFDTMVDPDAQRELFDMPDRGIRLVEFAIDARVGGTMTALHEGPDGIRYRITYEFTEVDRPRRLASTMSMHYSDSGVTETSTVSLTFDDQDGKTLVTLVQGGFETEQERDAYLSGAPGFLDALQRVVAERMVR